MTDLAKPIVRSPKRAESLARKGLARANAALLGGSIVRLTRVVTLAQLQAAGAVATGTFNIGGVLPVNARIVCPAPEVVITQQFAAVGLTTVVAGVRSSTDGVEALGTASIAGVPQIVGLTLPVNPYFSRGGAQLVVDVTLGVALLNALTAGAFSVTVLYAVVP